MSKAVMYVESRPVSAERDAEFNTWYEEVHIPEVVTLDGFVGARRFARTSEDGPYTAMYEIDADDVDAVVQAMFEAVTSGKLHMSDSFQMDPPPVMRVLKQVFDYEAPAKDA